MLLFSFTNCIKLGSFDLLLLRLALFRQKLQDSTQRHVSLISCRLASDTETQANFLKSTHVLNTHIVPPETPSSMCSQCELRFTNNSYWYAACWVKISTLYMIFEDATFKPYFKHLIAVVHCDWFSLLYSTITVENV